MNNPRRKELRRALEMLAEEDESGPDAVCRIIYRNMKRITFRIMKLITFFLDE